MNLYSYINKKNSVLFLFGLSFLLVIFVFFFLFYVSSFTSSKENIQEQEKPSSQINNLYILEKNPVLFKYWQKDNKLYYFNKENKLFSFDLASYKKTEENSSFSGIERIEPSLKGDKIILFWKKNDQKGLSIFDLEDKSTKVLPLLAEEASFSPEGDKIVFYRVEDNLPQLIIFNISDWKVEKIIDFPIYDINLSWLANGKILLVEKPTCYNLQKAFIFDLKSEKFSVLAEGYGLEYLVSPKRGKILFSFEKQRKSKIVSLNNKILASLKSFVLPEKCSFDSEENNLFCAVVNFPKNTCLPDKYWQGKISFTENLQKISLSNLFAKTMFESNISDAFSLITAKKSLIFFDRVSGNLYYFKF